MTSLTPTVNSLNLAQLQSTALLMQTNNEGKLLSSRKITDYLFTHFCRVHFNELLQLYFYLDILAPAADEAAKYEWQALVQSYEYF